MPQPQPPIPGRHDRRQRRHREAELADVKPAGWLSRITNGFSKLTNSGRQSSKAKAKAKAKDSSIVTHLSKSQREGHRREPASTRSARPRERESSSRRPTPTTKRPRKPSQGVSSIREHASASSSQHRSAARASRSRSNTIPETPIATVTCLICLSDLPTSKATKLSCNHSLCHSCLKRSFHLAVDDPALMPPKCCGAAIPLSTVAPLMSPRFLALFRRKRLEFATPDRMYCGRRGCGAWIRPADIEIVTINHKRRRVGKCRKCKEKVCAKCGQKAHKSRECPQDEATKALLASAAERGWMRCYSCKMLVELKEGCNHMTCRCTAQFCMRCGEKWKTCSCPWFNYADAARAGPPPPPPPPPPFAAEHLVEQLRNEQRFQRPVYRAIIDDAPLPEPEFRRPAAGIDHAARQRQEQDDRDLAARLQQMNLDLWNYTTPNRAQPVGDQNVEDEDWHGLVAAPLPGETAQMEQRPPEPEGTWEPIMPPPPARQRVGSRRRKERKQPKKGRSFN